MTIWSEVLLLTDKLTDTVNAGSQYTFGILVWFLGNYITDTVTGMTGTSRDCFAIHAMILVIEYPV